MFISNTNCDCKHIYFHTLSTLDIRTNAGKQGFNSHVINYIYFYQLLITGKGTLKTEHYKEYFVVYLLPLAF
jgi:hypothetical protein